VRLLAATAAALLFGATVAPVMAQDANGTGDTANDADRTVAVDTRDDDDGHFPWGLLGLLGLAGLMKGKQRTVVHNDTVRTTNTTGTR